MKPEFRLKETPIGPGLTVIEAGAGTGKTWTIAHLLPRLILDGTVEALSEAQLLTFTEAAARELADRVRRCLIGLVTLLKDVDPRPDAVEDLPGLLAKAVERARALKEPGYVELLELLAGQDEELRRGRLRRLLAARMEADRLNAGTILSFYRRVLIDEGFLCSTPPGFTIEPDLAEARRSCLRDVWRRDLAGDPLLATAAEARGWTLEADASAWALLEPADHERLYPPPKDLVWASAEVTVLLKAGKAAAGAWAEVAAILETVTLSKAGKEADIAGITAVLSRMDPEAPEPGDLAAFEEIASAPDWIHKNGVANKAASERVRVSALVATAERLEGALKDLEWAWRGHALSRARSALDRALRETNVLSYNDLASRLQAALEGPQGPELADRLRRRWKIALLDECQDTDRRQLAIVEAVFNRRGELDRSLVLIGDPKQSIYAFRGADLEAYESARDRPGTPVYLLTRTYRSAPGMVRCLNALFARPQPLASPRLDVPAAVATRTDAELDVPEGERRLRLCLVPEAGDREEAKPWRTKSRAERSAARAAVAALAALLGRTITDSKGGRRGIIPADCAVLVRSNRQARFVRDALVEAGLPSVVRGDEDVFATETAAELSALFQAALKPGLRPLRRAALATRLLGLDSAELEGLSEAQEESWASRFRSWGGTWKARGLAAFLAEAEDEGGLVRALASSPNGERRITDYRHLVELLLAEEAAGRPGPDRLMRRFEELRAEAARPHRPSDHRLQRLETDASAVQVLTLHRVKGLEFEFCFLPYLWTAQGLKEEALRLARMPGGDRLLVEPARLEKGESERICAEGFWDGFEEELRLAYVGLTRAKRQAWVLGGALGLSGRGKVELSPLDWLLREDRGPEDREAWAARIRRQKRPEAEAQKKEHAVPFTEHAAWAARLAEAEPLIALEAPRELNVSSPETPKVEAALTAEVPPPAPRSWRVASFTSLAGGGAHGHHDPSSVRPAESAEAPGQELLPLAVLPKGPQAGECLHAILETWDFRTVPIPGLEGQLRRHGMPLMLEGGLSTVELLEREFSAAAEAILPGLGSLKTTAGDARLSEWHFLLPLSGAGLEPKALGDLFARHPDPRLKDYAPRLRDLGAAAVRGMLQGYIDRLACGAGSWSVVDWKSNYLGSRAADYSQERLFLEASKAHYPLQVHLYLLAVRRYLRLRGAPDRLQGADLVFLRALRAGSSEGILHFDADSGFLDALEDRFFGGRT